MSLIKYDYFLTYVNNICFLKLYTENIGFYSACTMPFRPGADVWREGCGAWRGGWSGVMRRNGKGYCSQAGALGAFGQGGGKGWAHAPQAREAPEAEAAQFSPQSHPRPIHKSRGRNLAAPPSAIKTRCRLPRRSSGGPLRLACAVARRSCGL